MGRMKVQLNLLMEQFSEGQLVQALADTQPHKDGDIYGRVVSTGIFYVSVKMFTSGKVRKFTPDMIGPVTTGHHTNVRDAIRHAIWRGRIDPPLQGVINTLRSR